VSIPGSRPLRHAVGRALTTPLASRLIAESLRSAPGLIPVTLRNRLPTHRVSVKLPGGRGRLRFESVDDLVTRELFWHGFSGYEHASLATFLALLEAGPQCILDIGAFTGLYGFAAAACHPESVVHAFEPAPATYARLKENLSLNRLPNLTIHQLAISDRSGTITMYTVPDLQLSCRSSLVEGLNEATEPVEVPTDSLDDFVVEANISKVDLMKIDVESTEHRVLLGGIRVLDRDRPIMICEVLYGHFSPDLESVLGSRNYRYLQITERGLEVHDHIRGDPQGLDLNYLFAPEEKLAQLPAILLERMSGSRTE